MLSDDEAKTLVVLLSKCEPGNLPREVFEAVAKVAVYPAIEFVLLRESDSILEVLLTKRSDDDPVWPAMFHLPGTVLRPTDNNLDDAFKRLYEEELAGVVLSKPHFVGAHFNKYLRGNSIGLEYWLKVEGQTNVGQFFDISSLPENFIEQQKSILERARKAYRARY